MNICFINPFTIPRYEIYGLAKHLPSNYKMTVLQPSQITNSTAGFHIKENLYVKYVPAPFVSLHGSKITLPVLHSWLKALSDIMREGCDIIHASDYEYLTSIIPLLVRRIHVSTLIVNDAILGEESYVFGSSIMDLSARIYTPTVGRGILKRYDKVVLLYQRAAKEVRLLGISDEKIAVIPNGIDLRRVRLFSRDLDRDQIRDRLGLDSDEKIILYVGRLVGLKRVHIVIDTVKKLTNEGYRVKGIIVGAGSQRKELEDVASAIKDKVIFAGFVSEREKYEYYAIADLFMVPSLSEGLPTVLLESGAMGLPAIATNLNGIPDIVIHNKTGFLVDVSDTSSFVEYAKVLIEHEDLAREMGETAREHVRTGFSWDVMASRYQRVYEELRK